MSKEIWTTLRTYCLESTIIGLKYLYIHPGALSRCFWVLNLLVMLGLSWSVTLLLYGRFVEMPTRITIENQFEPVDKLPYPTITVCSPNQMTVSGMEYFRRTLIDDNANIDLEKFLPLLLGFYEQVDEQDFRGLPELQRIFDANRYTVCLSAAHHRDANLNSLPLGIRASPVTRLQIAPLAAVRINLFAVALFIEEYDEQYNVIQTFEEELKILEVMGKMPQSCDRFLKRCFLGDEYHKCTEIFKAVLTTHGNCCAFNSKYYFDGRNILVDHDSPIHNVKGAGLQAALTVVMDYNPDDAIPDTLLNAGSIRVMFTDWTEYPTDYETYLVDTNGESYMFITAVSTYCSDEVQTLPPWSRNCYFEDEHQLHVFRRYHNADCNHMCFVLAVLKTCKCWAFFIPTSFLKKEMLCNAKHIPCIINVKKNMSSWLTPELCVCPRDCQSRQYHAELNLGNFEALPHVIPSQDRLAGLKLNTSSSVINFMFLHPGYMKLKQDTVMSIISLVSNLGGVFGLFMGCSCISVLEVLFYMYKLISRYLASRPLKRRRNAVGITRVNIS